MDVRKWSSLRGRTIRFGRRQNDSESSANIVPSPEVAVADGSKYSLPKWKVMWKKLKRETKMLRSSVHNQQQLPYDEYTYSQNFDKGSSTDWDEPDILSRSFSVRFADPSSILPRKE